MVDFVFLVFLMPLICYFFIQFYRLWHLKFSLKIWKCLIMARLSLSFCFFSILFLLSFLLSSFLYLFLTLFFFLSILPSFFRISCFIYRTTVFFKKKQQLKWLQCHCLIAVHYITSNESKINLFLIVWEALKNYNSINNFSQIITYIRSWWLINTCCVAVCKSLYFLITVKFKHVIGERRV